MSKENRFEGLMGVVGKNKNPQTPKSSDVQKSSSKKKSSSRSVVKASKSPDISTSERSNIQTSTAKTENSELNVSTSKHTDAQTSKKAKSVDPNYTRTTLYLPKKMHKKLKGIALEKETEMSSIVEELIEGWLNSQG